MELLAKKENKGNRISFLPYIGDKIVSQGLIVGVVLIMIILSFLNPSFLTSRNLLMIVKQIAPLGVMACGLTFVLMGGNFDLSISTMLTLSATVACRVHNANGSLAAILATLGVGILCGVVNGYVVGYLGLNSMIATLGLQSVYLAIVTMYTGNEVTIMNDTKSWYANINDGKIFDFLTMPVVIFLVAAIIAGIVLSKTIYGRKITMVGESRTASIFSGVKEKFPVLVSYAICGLSVAIGAIMITAKNASARTELGNGYETDVLAIVILGGVSITGGKGKIYKVAIAAFFMGCLDNGFILIGLDEFSQRVARWILVILILAIEGLVSKRKGGRSK